MTYIVLGPNTAQNTDIASDIKTLISSNWSLTGELSTARIFFSTGWYDKNRQYQVHFRHDAAPTIEPYTLGGTTGINQVKDFVTIHVFVNTQQNQEPTNLGKITREIERIIESDVTALYSSKGYQYVRFLRGFYTVPMQDSQQSVYHSVAQLVILLNTRVA